MEINYKKIISMYLIFLDKKQKVLKLQFPTSKYIHKNTLSVPISICHTKEYVEILCNKIGQFLFSYSLFKCQK
jgi:hypothetical protein